jgi:hypothetical protein
MARKLLQINVSFDMEPGQFRHGMSMASGPIAVQPGLVWKIWLVEETRREGGGWYLFESEAQAQAYLESDVMQHFRSNPEIRDFSAKLFDIGEEASLVTRGPIG